jgi:hypothetical protein
MPLLWNQTYADIPCYIGGSFQAVGRCINKRKARLNENAQGFGEYTSMPQGYQAANRAIIPSLKVSGFIAALLPASSSQIASMTAQGNLSVTLTGESGVTAGANAAWNATASLTGEATLTPGLSAHGNMTARLDAGAQPSAFDIAQETMGQIVESGVSLKEVLRLLLAVAAGNATDLDTNPSFKSVDGSKTRVAGTRAGGTRTITTRDGT